MDLDRPATEMDIDYNDVCDDDASARPRSSPPTAAAAAAPAVSSLPMHPAPAPTSSASSSSAPSEMSSFEPLAQLEISALTRAQALRLLGHDSATGARSVLTRQELAVEFLRDVGVSAPTDAAVQKQVFAIDNFRKRYQLFYDPNLMQGGGFQTAHRPHHILGKDVQICMTARTRINTLCKEYDRKQREAHSQLRVTERSRAAMKRWKEKDAEARRQIGEQVSAKWWYPEVLFSDAEKLSVAYHCLAQPGDNHAWSGARTCAEFVAWMANHYAPIRPETDVDLLGPVFAEAATIRALEHQAAAARSRFMDQAQRPQGEAAHTPSSADRYEALVNSIFRPAARQVCAALEAFEGDAHSCDVEREVELRSKTARQMQARAITHTFADNCLGSEQMLTISSWPWRQRGSMCWKTYLNQSWRDHKRIFPM